MTIEGRHKSVVFILYHFHIHLVKCNKAIFMFMFMLFFTPDQIVKYFMSVNRISIWYFIAMQSKSIIIEISRDLNLCSGEKNYIENSKNRRKKSFSVKKFRLNEWKWNKWKLLMTFPAKSCYRDHKNRIQPTAKFKRKSCTTNSYSDVIVATSSNCYYLTKRMISDQTLQLISLSQYEEQRPI